MNNKLEFHLDDTVLYSGTVSDVRGFSTKTSNVLIHSVPHAFAKCLLYAGFSARCWGGRDE